MAFKLFSDSTGHFFFFTHVTINIDFIFFGGGGRGVGSPSELILLAFRLPLLPFQLANFLLLLLLLLLFFTKGSLHIRRASVNIVNIPLVTWFFLIYARVFMLLWMCNSPKWIRSSSTTYRLLVLVLQTIKRYIQLIVVGSLPCSERFFSGYSGIPLSSKTNTSKFQFDLERTDTFKRVHTNSYVLRRWTSNLHFLFLL